MPVTKTTKRLGMKFDTDLGKPVTISLAHCGGNIAADAVRDAMDSMIANQIFVYGLTGKVTAEIVDRTVTKLF